MIPTYPDIQDFHPASAGDQREADVILALAKGLPAGHAVFHSVLWSSMGEKRRQNFGEIDVIVLSPAGDLLLLEIKAGPLTFTETEITKTYADKTKDVLGQLNLQFGAFRQRMKEEKLSARIAQMLVAPDVRLKTGSIAYPRERIVDAGDFSRVAERALAALPEDAPNPQQFLRMQRFLLNLFELSPDPTARLDWLKTAVTRLSDGLATWATRIESANGRYKIEATAGSGKTQLSVRLLSAAAQNHQKALYCCFNQPLAAHLKAVLPGQAEDIRTFHELAIDAWRKHHGGPDFSRVEIFDEAAAEFCAALPEAPDLDLLIIDEAQDFAAEWVTALQRRLRPGGSCYLMQDDEQRLYVRDEAAKAFDAAVTIRSRDNFRSPRRLVETINALGLSAQPLVARCPVDGEWPAFHVWNENDPGGLDALAERVESLVKAGENPKNIVILSYHGRSRSRLLQDVGTIAGYPLRRFTGRFDAAGRPCWSPGLIQAETLYRFKGQAAPVILLAETDFAELDAAARRRLFVAMTRAEWRFECFLSQRAEAAMVRALSVVS